MRAWDRSVVLRLHPALESRTLRGVAIGLTYLGYGWNWLVFAPLSFVPELHAICVRLGLSLFVAWLVLTIMKRVIPRERPYRALQLRAWWRLPSDGSFPSGHAAGTFAVATFFTIWLWPLTPLAVALVLGSWLLAIAVAASRVFLAAHYPSDVLVGAALGSVCAAVGALV